MYMGWLWDNYGMTMECTYIGHGMTIRLLWDDNGMAMGWLWDNYGIYTGRGMTMGCIWVTEWLWDY